MDGSSTESPLAATWVLIPFAGGLLAGGLHHPGAPGAAFAVSLALVGLRLARAVPRRAGLAAAAAGIACGALTAVHAHLPVATDHIARFAGSGIVAVDGVVVQSDQAGARVALVVDVTRVRTRGRAGAAHGLVAVTIGHAAHAWPVGTQVHLVGKLRRPRNFANPGAYDHEGALARRGLRVTLFLWDDADVERLAAPTTGERGVDRVRAAVDARIAARTSEPVRGYLRAVLLGATRSLDDATRIALTRTGLAHVVSVSGFHIAVTAAACFLGLRWLLLLSSVLPLRLDATRLAATLGVFPVAAYAAIAGGSVPATRSFLTYGIVLAALACDRPPDGLRALALAAILLAVPTPDMAADVSFGLSFASVAALILVGSRDRQTRAPAGAVSWWHRLLLAPIRTSVAVTLATAPLTAWHFQQISLIAPVANLVTLPLLGPGTLLPGLAALPLALVSPALADRLIDVAAIAASLGLGIAARLAAWSWAAVMTPMPSLLELTLAYAALGLWWARPRLPNPMTARLRRGAALLIAVLTIADVAAWVWERHGNPTLRVTFLSVGQGDAAVVELPHGGVLIVDGGGFPGDFDPGERVIAPFLRARKILRVDVLALSHPQLDHYGGLGHLAEQFRPQAIWWNGTRGTGLRFAQLESALAAAGTRAVVLRRGMVQRLAPDVRVEVLHPREVEGISVNDASLVFRLRFGATSVLFTGDVEHGAERTLLGDRDRLRSDVLKVPHHGSATSSTGPWLAAVAPRIAVVSSGVDNRFGFPARQVVERLRAVGAQVWNTAEDGAVHVVSDGHDVRVTPMRSSSTPSWAERFEFPQLLW